MSEHIASKAELPEVLRPHLDAIVALVRAYGVERLEVFGSVMTDRFDPERSDIDFLVTYPHDYDYGPWLKRHFSLQRDLEERVGRSVDLVMFGEKVRSREYFVRSMAATRTVLYCG